MAAGTAQIRDTVPLWNTYRNLDVQPAGVLIKGAPAELAGFIISNTAAAVRFVKLYNKLTVGLATDTPVMTIQLPATSITTISFGASGVDFPLGLSIRGCNLVADADATAPTANDIVANVFYK
jgi:hypothetical protein